MCPNDGRLDLGLEDIAALVFKGPESIDIVFNCPRCGAALHATLHVPNLLGVAMELARHVEGMSPESTETRPAGERPTESDVAQDAEAVLRAERERAGEPYCEYFRRQLAR